MKGNGTLVSVVHVHLLNAEIAAIVFPTLNGAQSIVCASIRRRHSAAGAGNARFCVVLAKVTFDCNPGWFLVSSSMISGNALQSYTRTSIIGSLVHEYSKFYCLTVRFTSFYVGMGMIV